MQHCDTDNLRAFIIGAPAHVCDFVRQLCSYLFQTPKSKSYAVFLKVGKFLRIGNMLTQSNKFSL